MQFPGEAPFYWLEKISESNTPKIEITNYLPPPTKRLVYEFRKDFTGGGIGGVIDYGATTNFELPPGDYQFKIIDSSTTINIKEGYNYKLIYAPKDEDGKPVDPSTLPSPKYSQPSSEYNYFAGPASPQPMTSMPTVMPTSTIAEQTAETTVTTPNTTAARQDTTTQWIALIGGVILVLAIVLIAGKFYGKRQRAPEKTTTPTVSESAPPSHGSTLTKEGVAIKIKRGYEVLQNNDLRFGIRVINNTGYMIGDVETKLDYPKTLFSLKGNVVQGLANISPNGERTAKYILAPLGCIHSENIEATIFYKNHTGKKQTVQMHPKEVHCVCPFLKEKAMREGEFAKLTNTCEHIEDGLSFNGITVNEITTFIKESCTHRLYVIGEHEIETTKIVYFAGESIGEKACYLLTAVIQPYKNLTQIALRAYSDKPYGLRGFLNEIANSIRHLVGSVQSATEIGVIESKQVINIIDSVVQRTSFGGSGEGIGETSVNIEGSVVQRTEVGSIKRCSSCGKEVQADEKFCKVCGARLK